MEASLSTIALASCENLLAAHLCLCRYWAAMPPRSYVRGPSVPFWRFLSCQVKSNIKEIRLRFSRVKARWGNVNRHRMTALLVSVLDWCGCAVQSRNEALCLFVGCVASLSRSVSRKAAPGSSWADSDCDALGFAIRLHGPSPVAMRRCCNPCQPPPLFGHRTKGHYKELQKAFGLFAVSVQNSARNAGRFWT